MDRMLSDQGVQASKYRRRQVRRLQEALLKELNHGHECIDLCLVEEALHVRYRVLDHEIRKHGTANSHGCCMTA